MKALIFNSGIGKRMGSLTADKPKCLTKLYNGETIFERQVRILKSLGIKEFIVTVGPYKEMIMEAAERFEGVSFTFVPNEMYESSNYILSFYNARDVIDSDILMLHGDLVFEGSIVWKLLNAPERSVCIYNPEKLLPEKDFKGRIIEGTLRQVSVDIFDKDCYAFQPLYKLSYEDVGAWLDRVAQYIEAGDINCYAENALNDIADTLSIKAISYSGCFVEEIDNEEDYVRVNDSIKYIEKPELKPYDEMELKGYREKENLPQFVKNRPVMIIIILANVIAYIMCIKIGGNQFEQGGINFEHVIRNHEFGRLISYMFLHKDFEHLFFNMTALFLYGISLEGRLGSLRFAGVYFGSGIGAGLISIFASHMINPDRMRYAVGASAAVYGVLTAAAFLQIKGRNRADKKTIIKTIAIIVLFALLTNSSGVDTYGHVGGAILGGILVFGFSTGALAKKKNEKFEAILAVIIAIVLSIAGIGEAGFGRNVKELADERVDFIKEQPMYKKNGVGYGEAFEYYFLSTSWKAFTSEDDRDIVEFNGETYYKGEKAEVIIQFTLQGSDSYKINYFSINGEAKTGEEYSNFMRDCYEQYMNKEDSKEKSSREQSPGTFFILVNL